MNRLLLAAAALLVAASFAAPLLPLPHPDAVDLSNRLLPPASPGHLLGTDSLGRDLLARLLSGTRTSLLVASAATAISLVLGTLVGITAGFLGGKTDTTLMRGVDLLMAFPYLVLALALVAVLGPGLVNALLAIAIVNIPFFARTIRGATVPLARSLFIEAASTLGAPPLRIVTRHLLPNLLPAILAAAGTTLAWMLLETAGLSFLGLGAQPPKADLGSMLADSRRIMLVHPYAPLVPGLAILLLAAAANHLAARAAK